MDQHEQNKTILSLAIIYISIIYLGAFLSAIANEIFILEGAFLLALFLVFVTFLLSYSYIKKTIFSEFKDRELFRSALDDVLRKAKFSLVEEKEHRLLYRNTFFIFKKLGISISFQDDLAKIDCYHYLKKNIEKQLKKNQFQIVYLKGSPAQLFVNEKGSQKKPSDELLDHQKRIKVFAISLGFYAFALFFATLSTFDSGQLSTFLVFSFWMGLFVLIGGVTIYSLQEVYVTAICEHRKGFLFTFDKILGKSEFILEGITDNSLFYERKKFIKSKITVHFYNSTAKISCPRYMKDKIEKGLKKRQKTINKHKETISRTSHSNQQQSTPQNESHSPTLKENMTELKIDIAPNSLPVGTAPYNFAKNCIVCKGEIMEKDKFISCPFCGEAAHSKHFLEWMKINASCPNCKRSVKAEWWIY